MGDQVTVQTNEENPTRSFRNKVEGFWRKKFHGNLGTSLIMTAGLIAGYYNQQKPAVDAADVALNALFWAGYFGTPINASLGLYVDMREAYSEGNDITGRTFFSNVFKNLLPVIAVTVLMQGIDPSFDNFVPEIEEGDPMPPTPDKFHYNV